MKKRLFSLMLFGILIISFIGCGNSKSNAINSRFKDTGDSYDIGNITYNTYYDIKTKTVYIADPEGYRSGITVLYNADRKPMTLDKYNNKNKNRFIDVNDGYEIGDIEYEVYCDTETNIIYIADADGYRSGITAMYNTDGNPMNLDEYNKTK